MNQPDKDFLSIRRGAIHGLVHRDHEERTAAALFEGAGCRPCDATGRGAMMCFPLPDGRMGILRVCRRSGLVQRFLKESFLFRNRPLEEFHAHHSAYTRGVPAPPLLGVRWERRGLLYYGALATELLPGCDLEAWLRVNEGEIQKRRAVVVKCGACIRQMHECGVYHADLQIKNIFISDDAVFLLDFDRARTHTPLHAAARARNLLRLRRSLEKRGHAECWPQILEGYGAIAFPRWLDALYRFKAHISDMMHGRRTTQV